MLSGFLVFFKNIKFWLGAGAIVLLLAIGVGAKYYYDSTQDRISELVKSNTESSLVIKLQENTITKMNETFEEYKRLSAEYQRMAEELNTRLVDAESEVGELRTMLSEHDLEMLAYEKPGLIEKRINDATDKALDDLESITNLPK